MTNRGRDDPLAAVKGQVLRVLDELYAHDGYAGFRVEIRILRRGQKEVIVDAGKQYRYVVDFQPGAAAPGAETPAFLRAARSAEALSEGS